MYHARSTHSLVVDTGRAKQAPWCSSAITAAAVTKNQGEIRTHRNTATQSKPVSVTPSTQLRPYLLAPAATRARLRRHLSARALATTFERDTDLTLRSSSGYCYARIANPTRSLFERAVAAAERPTSTASEAARNDLEVDAAAFASGMAAVCSVFPAMPRGHVLLSDDVYHGVRSAYKQHLARGDWATKLT